MVYTSAFAGPDPYLANNMPPYDTVLRNFPKLKIILGHGGYPCVKQVVDFAPRLPNLYVCADIYNFWPAGHLYRRQIDQLQDQYIFGASYPFSSMTEPLDETLKLPLSKEGMEKYLWGNGARLLKLLSRAQTTLPEAVVTRGREVFYGHVSLEEKEALEDALYALHAFRTSWQHSEAA